MGLTPAPAITLWLSPIIAIVRLRAQEGIAFRAIAFSAVAFVVLVACGQAGIAPAPNNPPAPTAGSAAPRATQHSLGFTIDFIDVGQGDATLITASTGETLLIDGGRSRARIRDRLEMLGVEDLDAIAATHMDADHIAGLVEVLEMFSIERIYLNGGQGESKTFSNFEDGVNSEGAEVLTVEAGDVIPLGALVLTVLHPSQLTGDSNVDSMVLLLDCGDVEVLLTGDAETPSEEAMIQAGVLYDIDVLKIGHHGSRTSSSQEFLDATKPEYGVISAGLDSQYGHPHPEIVERLEARGMILLYTDSTEFPDGVRMSSDCSTFSFDAQ